MAKKARRAFSLTDYSKDITINDFANSSVPKTGRVKKNEINNVISRVKNLSVAENDESWDEKLKYLDSNGTVNKNGSKRTLKNKRKEEGKIRASASDKNCTIQYRTYPIELWFKVSEFIAPEDVGRFASICSDTWAVVLTARFWYGLYERHYKKVPDLPELLQPQCMVRRYGLRANVIRALYFMYPPFVNKLRSEVVFDGNPHRLVKRVCILSWSQKQKNHWLFYFKLKHSQQANFGREVSDDKWKPGLLEMLEDISANVDEDCKMLEALKGHGNFRTYLVRRKLVSSDTCVGCDTGLPDEVNHVLFRCERWKDLRSKFHITDGFPDLLALSKQERDSFFEFVSEVTCMNYVPLPMISGQRLNGVSLTLSQDFQHHKLELNFGCGTSPHMGSSYVTLDSVSKIRVLDWWHPSFPHSNGLNYTSYSSESNYLMDEIDSNII